MATGPDTAAHPAADRAWSVETNGINVIADGERRGRPRDLFWPWAAANISVLGLPYGAFLLGFDLSVWQALLAGIAGVVLSFLLVGVIALAGSRGGAPTMTLSRAAFGVVGNSVPTLVSYLSLVGWETFLVATATLATSTVFERLGLPAGRPTLVVAFLVCAAAVMAVGMLGYTTLMRVQTWFTVAFAVLTVVYVALMVGRVRWGSLGGLSGGGVSQFLGGLSIVMAGFGIGWVNCAADYSRYLPRRVNPRGVVGWTSFGGALPPVLLVTFGVFVAAGDPDLSARVAANPVGALAEALPTWFLVPFVVVAVGGLVAGAVMDIYSSGLNLLALGVPFPRWAAVGVDGVLMVAGTLYLVFGAQDFIGPFTGFLVTLGVPITAWAAVFAVDLLWYRREGYADRELYDRRGRYGAVNPAGLAAMVLATAVGLGLVTSTAAVFSWTGYLLGPLGLGGRQGQWGAASLGVMVAFVAAAVLYAALAPLRRHRTAQSPPPPGGPGDAGVAVADGADA